MDIELLRATLTGFGLSLHSVLFSAAVTFTVLFFSTRFLLTWYLGTMRIFQELKALRAELAELNAKLESLHKAPAAEKPADTFKIAY